MLPTDICLEGMRSFFVGAIRRVMEENRVEDLERHDATMSGLYLALKNSCTAEDMKDVNLAWIDWKTYYNNSGE